MLPLLICIVPDIVQERRVQRVAQARLGHTPGLVLWTTTEVLLNEYGSLAPIWLRGIAPHYQVALPGSELRQGLSDVFPGKNGT